MLIFNYLKGGRHNRQKPVVQPVLKSIDVHTHPKIKTWNHIHISFMVRTHAPTHP